jgi:aminopeptidase Y
MARLSLSVALLALQGASAFQIPLLSSLQKQIPVAAVAKTPVTTEALQALISSDNLLKRAEHLFEIAKLGVDEYGHPTRVIGSQGVFSSPSPASMLDSTMIQPLISTHRSCCDD